MAEEKLKLIGLKVGIPVYDETGLMTSKESFVVVDRIIIDYNKKSETYKMQCYYSFYVDLLSYVKGYGKLNPNLMDKDSKELTPIPLNYKFESTHEGIVKDNIPKIVLQALKEYFEGFYGAGKINTDI